MSENLPAVQDQQHQPAPFQRTGLPGHSINHGAVAIESERAIAEAQGKLTLAKKFPRSMTAAMSDFMDACNNQEFAKTAFYTVKNRGSGPSIRMAEEAARCYGNFVYGHRELSRSEGKSEIEVYAWDMEKNNESKRQITVMHILDTADGPRKLTQQADIDNKIANVASKQMRGRILALMPKHMMAAGIAAAKLALAGGGEKPISERILAMSKAFGKFGVTSTHLTTYLGHSIDDTTLDELADLMGIFNAIKEGAKASEYFKLTTEADDATTSTAAAITQRAKAGAEAAKAKPQAAKTAAPASQEKGKTVESDSKPTESPKAESTEKTPAAAVSRSEPEASSEDDDVF